MIKINDDGCVMIVSTGDWHVQHGVWSLVGVDALLELDAEDALNGHVLVPRRPQLVGTHRRSRHEGSVHCARSAAQRRRNAPVGATLQSSRAVHRSQVRTAHPRRVGTHRRSLWRSGELFVPLSAYIVWQHSFLWLRVATIRWNWSCGYWWARETHEYCGGGASTSV